MVSIKAKARRDFLTRSELAAELQVSPSAITKALARGVLEEPLRVVFPAGNHIEAWPRVYVDEYKQHCTAAYRLPTTPPPLALDIEEVA